MTASRKPDWLIIFLVLDNMELTRYINDLLCKIKHTRLRDTIKIYFLIDTVKRITQPGDPVGYGLEVAEVFFNPVTATTDRKDVVLDHVTVTDRDAWVQAIRELIRLYPACFRVLIPWSHATAISVADPTGGGGAKAVYKTGFNLIRDYRHSQHHFDKGHLKCNAFAADPETIAVVRTNPDPACLALEQLFISDIANSLADITRDQPFDLIVMSNCYTQMVDNCYNLRHVTRFYMAPETLVALSVFDFGLFINSINEIRWKNGLRSVWFGLVGRVLRIRKNLLFGWPYKAYFRYQCRSLLDGFGAQDPSGGNGAAIIVNDLRRMDQIAPLLDNIACHLMEHPAVFYPKLVKVLALPGIRHSTKSYLDLIMLFDAMEKEFGDRTFSAYYRDLKRFLSTVRVASCVGDDLGRGLFHYFTIFMPVKLCNRIEEPFCCQYFRDNSKSAFVEDMSWDDLVRDSVKWRRKYPQPDEPSCDDDE